ncbi:MAG: hypothetical protein HY827_02320 [Actinobacteria bacterium]|nr:hypothetical protein [Actinomycetota bacterium]
MAQAKRKRKTKHRGTQAGTIESRGRTSRPSSRADARQQTLQRRQQQRYARANQPPTWRGATIRAALMAAVLLVVLLVVKQKPAPAIFMTVVMFGAYIPMGYYMDNALFKMRQKREADRRAKAAQNGDAPRK